MVLIQTTTTLSVLYVCPLFSSLLFLFYFSDLQSQYPFLFTNDTNIKQRLKSCFHYLHKSQQLLLLDLKYFLAVTTAYELLQHFTTVGKLISLMFFIDCLTFNTGVKLSISSSVKLAL